MNRIVKASIKIKLVSLIMMIIGVVLITDALYQHVLDEEQASKELNALSDRVIQRLADNLMLPLWEVDSHWVERIITIEMQDKQIQSILVTGEGGILVGKKRNDLWEVVSSKKKIMVNHSHIIRHTSVDKSDERVGQVHVVLSTHLMKEKLSKKFIAAGISTVIVITLISISLVLMLNRILIHPLLRLIDFVKLVSAGEYNRTDETFLYGEIGLLNREFNSMQGNIVQREKDLRDSQSKVHLLLDSTAEAIYGVDRDGCCTFVNKSCLTMLGFFNPEDVLGKYILDLICPYCPARESSAELSLLSSAFQNQKKIHVDNVKLYRIDGSVFNAEYWSHPIVENGHWIGSVVTFLDISERIAAGIALQEREQNLAVTLNSIGDAVIATDPEGRVTRMNPMAEQFTGWSLDDAMNKPINAVFSIIDATTRLPLESPIENVISTGHVVHLSQSATLVSRDGTERQISDSAAPIRNLGDSQDDEDEILGMVLVFNDMTEEYALRKEVRESQRLMQGLMDNLKSMVGIMQLDGRILFINQVPLLLSKTQKTAVLGEHLWDCGWFSSNSDIRQQVKNAVEQAAQGDISVSDVVFQAIDRKLWMELDVYPVRENGIVTQLVFEGVDISQRKKNETLQKNHQLNLENQVKERTAELEAQTAELARATKLKSEFLANISHELRTPMNSIIGFTGRVINTAEDKLDKRQLNNLRIVERNAHHLLLLINGLLDLSKIEAGMMEVRSEGFDLSLLVNEVVSLSQTALDDKPVDIRVEQPEKGIILHTDYLKLKQILINLVSNAIKFTDKGTIKIQCELLPVENESKALKSDALSSRVSISIKDTGVGMSHEALNYIFEAFRQVDGKITRRVGGTGLGLAIVSSFIKLLSGEVQVRSVVNRGSTFQIIIPVNLNHPD